MAKEIRLGSEQYPLKLTAHGGNGSAKELLISGDETGFSAVRRGLVTEFVDLPHENKTLLNFYKLKEQAGSQFLKNLISNPYLSDLDLKLAIYFYELSLSQVFGFLCIINPDLTIKKISRLIGDDCFLYYGFESDNYPFYCLSSSVHLKDVFGKLNIEYSPSLARAAILKLHNFSYITVTEIRWPNVHKRALRSLEIPDDKTEYGLFIQICPMMVSKSVSKYWRSKGN